MSLLTDKEIDECCKSIDITQVGLASIHFARAIEQAVIAKLATVSVEPVACYAAHRLTPEGTTEFYGYADKKLEPSTMLYTTEAIAAARVQALEDFKAELADALCADCENGVKYLNEQALEKFRNDYPTLSALIGDANV